MGGASGLAGLVVAALVLAVTPLTAAEEATEARPKYAGEATTTAGYRTIDIDGSKEKYREDYNLRSGGRLFNFAVKGSSTAPDTTPLDRFDLAIDTPGDEPVSHFRLSAADRERFDLRAAFTRSKYEYAVPQLFEGPVEGDFRTDDLHDFDFVRTNGSVDLRVRAPGLPTLRFGYRLYRRDGDSISTVRIPDGDTFLVRAPIDTVTHVGLVGTDFRAFDTDIFLQQEYRRVDRDQVLGDPLNPAGLDRTDSSTLGSYRSDQDQHIGIPATTLRLRREMGDGAELTAAYFFSRADLSFDYGRQRRGTSTPGGFGSTATATGQGDATLTTSVVDLATSVPINEYVSVHGAYRLNDRSQDGSFGEVSNFGLLDAETEDDVRIHSLSGEIEVEPRANLSLRGGLRYGRRDANLSLSGEEITDTVGAIGSARFRPWSSVDLFARYENVQIHDPFVVAGDDTNVPRLPEREISLTFTNRASAGIGLSPWDWAKLQYRFTADSRENDSFDGSSRAFGNSVALTLTPVTGLTLLASYTRRDYDNRADIYLAPLYERSSSVQDGNEDVFVSMLQYDFALLGQRWSGGWSLSFVDSDSSMQPRLEEDGRRRSFFDLDRVDGEAFLTLYHRLLEPTVEFRMTDYNQNPLTQNDYRSTMVVLKATRRFSF